MKKNNLYIIIAILFASNIFTLLKISSIENLMESNIHLINNTQNNMEKEISDIYFNVDEKLKKQASIIDSYDINFGEKLNPDDLTVPVSVSLTPKEITEETTAILLINDIKYPMAVNGATFTASINASIFDPLHIKVILINNGTEKIETLEEYNDLQYKYILNLHGRFSGRTKYNSDKYQYDGNILLSYNGSSKDEKIVSINISRYINGALNDEKDVPVQEQPITYSVNDEVELSSNDIVELYIIVQDIYGLQYKYIVLKDEIDDKGKLNKKHAEWTAGSLMDIKDKNGNVLLYNNY